MKNHPNVIREFDEMMCPTCGKRWDVNDPYPPKCNTKKENGLNKIAQLRDKYFKRD